MGWPTSSNLWPPALLIALIGGALDERPSKLGNVIGGTSRLNVHLKFTLFLSQTLILVCYFPLLSRKVMSDAV